MNQNKGIGAYKDRPGYFMGGMIGGAILGALVNKIQGKDWKRGALMGGITGGVMGAPGMSGVLGKMKPGLMKNLLTTGTQYGGTAAWSPLAKYGIPAAVTYFAGDPESDRRKQEEFMAAQNEVQKKKNIEMYPDWYKNFFSGFFKNKGGMIDERPGYYNGGPTGAPMGGTWSDVPMGEGGPTQDPEIMRLPMGQEGSFEDENEGILGLELAGLSDDERTELQSLMSLRLVTPKDDPKYEQIEIRIQELMGRMGQETAMSEPHPDEGAYDMFFDEFGRYPKDSEELRLFLDEIDLDVPAVARGGYMERPGYYGGGMGDMDLTQGGASFGPGTGTSDDIPAMLSDGEFVVTANAVKNLGGGNRMLGAKRMYSMMNQLDPNSQTPAEMDTTGIA